MSTSVRVDPPDTVLVPVDGSELSKRALAVAIDEHPDAEVIVLHVIDPGEPGYSYPIEVDPEIEPRHGSEAWLERSHELAERLFDEAETIADERGGSVRTETVVGRAARAVVEFAEEHEVDAIVVGGHGRDDPANPLLGSVTEAVVFRSPVRVTVVK